MLPRGVHVVIADIVQDTTAVDEIKYIEPSTANGVFYNLFLSGRSAGTFFGLGIFSYGI